MSYSDLYPRSAARYGDPYEQQPDAGTGPYDPYEGTNLNQRYDPPGPQDNDQYQVHDTYNSGREPHQMHDAGGFEPGGYRDDPLPPLPSRKTTQESTFAHAQTESGHWDEHNGFGPPEKKER
jgi:hypothetical protein